MTPSQSGEVEPGRISKPELFIQGSGKPAACVDMGVTSPKQLEMGSQEELGSRKPGSSAPGQAPLSLPLQASWQVGHGEGAPPSPTLSVLSPRFPQMGQMWPVLGERTGLLLLPGSSFDPHWHHPGPVEWGQGAGIGLGNQRDAGPQAPPDFSPQLSTTAVPTVRVGNKGGGDKLVAGYMEEERTGLRKKRHFRLDTVSLGCLAGGGGQECRLDSNPNSSVF